MISWYQFFVFFFAGFVKDVSVYEALEVPISSRWIGKHYPLPTWKSHEIGRDSGFWFEIWLYSVHSHVCLFHLHLHTYLLWNIKSVNGDSRCASFLASNVYLPCFLSVFIRQFVYSSNVHLAQLVGYLWTSVFLLIWHATVDRRDPFHQLQLIWYISYCFTSFYTSQAVHTMLTLENNTPQEFSNPIDPDFRMPPWFRSEGILASYWPKRKRISGSILVHNCGLETVGTRQPFNKKVWENHGFGWFGSTDLGGECDTEVNCRCSETQKNYIMYPISFVSRSFKN